MNELSFTEMTVKVPCELQIQAQKIAEKQGETLSGIIQAALEFYINTCNQTDGDAKEKTDFEEARILMRELGKGLAEGSSPHDTARNHDFYIYSKSI